MWPAVHAETDPDRPAYVMAGTGEVVTYGELDDRSNRLAQLLFDRGLRFGDHVALFMDNSARYLEVAWAAQRSGLYFTTVNYHFTAEEVVYIVDNCDAKAIVVSAALGEVVDELAAMLPERVEIRLAEGADVAGFERYEDAVAAYPAEPLAEELEGHAMLYSSGTTGRPKGIKYPLERRSVGSPAPALAGFQTTYGIDADCVYLSPAPLYHSAPLQFCIGVTRFGGTAVIMEKFEPEDALRLIQEHRVTHAQFVPTMFVRMLKLPEDVRTRYDVSSMQIAIHAAAPCPVPVKHQMIEWWGPIITEYYGATEGTGATLISAEEWLAHPGSVGRPFNSTIHVLDEDDHELPQGESGVIWFEPTAESLTFEYYKDADKTESAHNRDGWATVGDMGYLDEEGYLYLTDRRDFMIVSGGVNIYPQEAENLLITHPKVLDVAVFGVPNEEMGEEVKGVVQPVDMADAGPALEAELLEFCRTNLAHYKCPKTIDFDPDLPRQPTGKLYKRLLRDRYWTGRETPDRVSDDVYVALLDDLDAEEASLDATVSGLDDGGWSTPTPAEGWTVGDSIAHLAATEMWATLALTDPDGFRAELAGFDADATRRADEVRTGLMFRRPPPGVDTLTWWRETRSRAGALLRARDRADRLPWFGPDMSSMSFATARLMETWAHGVDVRDALGIDTEQSDRLRQVAELGVRTRGWSYVVRGREAPDVAVRVELDAPGGDVWTWGDDDAPDSVRGPALDFCLVVTQRRNVRDTALVVTGDAAPEWLDVAQAFAGAATPPRPARRSRS